MERTSPPWKITADPESIAANSAFTVFVWPWNNCPTPTPLRPLDNFGIAYSLPRFVFWPHLLHFAGYGPLFDIIMIIIQTFVRGTRSASELNLRRFGVSHIQGRRSWGLWVFPPANISEGFTPLTHLQESEYVLAVRRVSTAVYPSAQRWNFRKWLGSCVDVAVRHSNTQCDRRAIDNIKCWRLFSETVATNAFNFHMFVVIRIAKFCQIRT